MAHLRRGPDIVAWLLALASAAGIVRADPAADPGLGDEAYLFQDIDSVFAASRYDQPVGDAPSAVTVITRDEIRRFGYRDLNDVLSAAIGFFTVDDRSYPHLGVRGFQRPGDLDNRVLLLVDGLPLNDPVYDSAPLATYSPVDVAHLERVEVVRGPGSSLYGTNAIFAVINLVTRKGRDLDGAEIEAAAGDLGTLRERVAYGQRFDNGVEVMAGAAVLDRSGNARLYVPEFDTPTTGDGVAHDLDGERYVNALSTVSWRGFQAQGGFGWRRKAYPGAPFGTVFDDPQSRLVDLTGFARLGWTGLPAERLALSANLAYLRYRCAGDYPLDYSDEGDGSRVLVEHDLALADWLVADVVARWSLAERLALVFGADGRAAVRVVQSATYAVDPPGTPLDDHRRTVAIGAYGQAEWRLVDSLLLNAGLRYDRGTTFGDFLSPRAALLFNPLPSTRFKLLYGRAFRAPNAYETYYHDGYQTQKPGGSMSPETIQTFETVYEQDLADAISGKLSVFHYRTRALIDLVQDPADGLLVLGNTGGIDALGAETSLSLRLAGGLTADAGYAWTHAYPAARWSGQVANSSAHQASGRVSVPLWSDRLFASTELRALGPRHTVKGADVGWHVQWRAVLSSRNLPWKGLELTAAVYNLLNRRDADPVSTEYVQSAMEGDGLTLRFGVTYAF